MPTTPEARQKISVSPKTRNRLRQLAGLYGETMGETIDRALAAVVAHDPPTIDGSLLQALGKAQGQES